jgi:predicted secreted protein
MNWISGFAVYFVIWWTVLFAMIPFGVRTQEEEGDVTLGTTASAPSGSHMGKAVLRTTVVSALIYGFFYVLTSVYGWSFEDIPNVLPDF